MNQARIVTPPKHLKYEDANLKKPRHNRGIIKANERRFPKIVSIFTRPLHCGIKPGRFETSEDSLSHELGSE